jgi:hypothetical protein
MHLCTAWLRAPGVACPADGECSLAYTSSAQVHSVAFLWAPASRRFAAAQLARQNLVGAARDGLNQLRTRTWAEVVARLLRPGGRLFLRDGHPMLGTLSLPRPDGLVVVEYPYFERPEGVRFVETKSYVDHEGELASPETVEFNHGLGEVVTALMRAGLTLTALEEHDSAPWAFLPGATVVDAQGEHRLAHRPERLAVTYTLQASKAPR